MNGLDMYYEVHGKGTPLLLLHGFTGSGADLVSLFSDFANDHQLIIPDLRGHGRSNNPSDQFQFRQVALDLFALLDALEVKQCHAVGFSGGGCALLHMATQQADRIKSMALISATPYYPVATRALMRQYASMERSTDDWNAMRKIHLNGDAQIAKIYEYGKAFSEDFSDMNFTPALLSTIQAKTLIIQGDRDPFYPVELSVEMYRSIPNASLWILPNGSHVPFSREAMGDFLQQIRMIL